jgi:hypothetical protein
VTNRQMNRMIKVAIYNLKRQYGNGPVDIYQASGSYSVDLTTGVKTRAPVRTRLKTAVVLPAKIQRHLESTISKISADKPFVYGGTFDRTKRVFLVDQKDAPDLSLTPDDWLVYRRRKYKVASFDEFEHSSLWVITAHELLGERPSLVHDVHVTELITLTEDLQNGVS